MSDMLDLTEKPEFPSCNYDLEVNVKAIYKSDTHNYLKSNNEVNTALQ